MIHIYHGSGKGKTTAAFGLAMRMAGHCRKTLIVQFLKDGDSGEMRFAKRHPEFHCLFYPLPKTFYYQMSEAEQRRTRAQQLTLFAECRKRIQDYDCLILDEILDVMEMGWLEENAVLAFLKSYKDKEIVLTGRNACAALFALADYSSEISERKHPYHMGVPPREGVEY